MTVWLALPLTLAAYFALVHVTRKWQKPLLNPVLLCILFTVLILTLIRLPYGEYRDATWPLSALLEPAIVALALPLYRQARAIRQQLPAILAGVILGVGCATLVALVIARLFAAPEAISASFAALAVTTPITLLVSDSLGGIPSLAAVMVILIGILGALFGFGFLRLVGVRDPYAQGLALGTACHAIGTAAALKENEQAGAFASVALALSALVSAIMVPLIYPWLLALFNGQA